MVSWATSAPRLDHDRLAGAGGFLQFDRLFDRELVVRIGNELDAGFVDRLAVGGDDDLGRGVGDPLEADCDFHSPTSGTVLEPVWPGGS